MTVQDDIIRFLKVTGPTIPSKVAKQVKTEILYASAHLSDLASQKKVKISCLKIGGTPLYYLPGQEDQLFHFAAGNLNPKDYIVVEKLKNEKVLRESDLDLLTKVSLRGLKDFAIQLNVTTPERTELFWRWYLTPADETNQLISNILDPKHTIIPIASEVKPDTTQDYASQLQNEYHAELQERYDAEQRSAAESKVSKSSSNSTIKVQTTLIEVDSSSQVTANAAKQTSSPQEQSVKKRGRPKSEHRLQIIPLTTSLLPTPPLPTSSLPPTLSSTLTSAERILKKNIDTEFGKMMESYFEKLNIESLEGESIRKTEINYIVKIPSAVGHIKYVVKAKQKIKTDEKDLAAAYLEAQLKKLPLLYLYTGELTKKAQEMIAVGAYENMTLKRIE